jgi:hypothetical protein
MKRMLKLAGLALATLALGGAALADLHFNGHLPGAGAVRWHSVHLTAGKRYWFKFDPENRDLRVNMKLYKASPFVLVKEKYANEAEERMGFRPTVAGNYWMKLTSLNAASPYELELEED